MAVAAGIYWDCTPGLHDDALLDFQKGKKKDSLLVTSYAA